MKTVRHMWVHGCPLPHHGFSADAYVAYETVSSRCSGEGRHNLSWLSNLGNSRGEDISLTKNKNILTPGVSGRKGEILCVLI